MQASLHAFQELAAVETRLFEGAGLTGEQLARDVEAFDPDIVGLSA